MLFKGKKLRIISLITCLVMVAAIFAGCGSQPAAQPDNSSPAASQNSATPAPASESAPAAKNASISFMGWGGPEEKATFTELTKKFMEKYPNVKVEYVNVPAEDFMVKLQTMVAGNQQPDVFYFPPDYLMRWVSSGNLLDLTPYMQNSEIFDANNIWPRLLDRYRYDGTSVGKGDIYALPKDVGPLALAYNKDLFKAAGIPDPDPKTPWTWEEFIANAQKLTKGEGADKQFGVAGYSIEAAIYGNGADWLDSAKTKITIDEPKFIEGLQFIADLALKHGVAPTREEEQALGAVQRWMNGKVGMTAMGPWHQAQFWTAPFEWDVMPWPVSKAGQEPAVWYGSMGFAVSPTTEFKQEAFNLAAFLAFDRDSQKINYEMGQAVPNLIDMAKNDWMNSGKAPKSKQVFIDIIEKYGRPASAEFTYDGEWIGEFWGTWEKVMRGEMTAEAYCKEEQPKLQELLDKSIEKKNKK